jgi:hypothetical protein
MKVLQARWGEVTIKKQGLKGKNNFDKTKSFSIIKAGEEYDIEEYTEILRLITDLTQKYDYNSLKKKIDAIE